MLRLCLRLLIPCLAVLVFSVASTHDALACSGGYLIPSLPNAIWNADAIVDGNVIWVDDTRRNFILRVKSYLNGRTGPRDLVVETISPLTIGYSRYSLESQGCGFSTVSNVPLDGGDNLVMFLVRNKNGSYSTAPEQIFYPANYARFETPESRIMLTYADPSTPRNNIVKEATREELLALIQSEAGRSLTPLEAPAPLYAPLLITTRSGTRYILPIDGAIPVEIPIIDYMNLKRFNDVCWWGDCTIWSSKYNMQQMVLGAQSREAYFNAGINRRPYEAAIFSPVGDAYAFWEKTDNKIVLKIAVVNAVTTWGYTYDFPPEPVFPEVSYDQQPESFEGLGAWSQDGRILAFIDSHGLWIWDVFTPESQPVLSDYKDVTALHGFSPLGRYLHLTQNGEKKYIDLISGITFPDGVWGPDDRVLITYDPPKIIRFVPYSETPLDIKKAEYMKIQWIGRWEYILMQCATSPTDCHISHNALNNFSGYPISYFGYAFDHSRDTNSLVIVQDEQTLLIRDGITGEHREISLRGNLDHAIASVEWLPSLFYDATYDTRVR